MKKISILLLCCGLAGCIAKSGGDYDNAYSPYEQQPYATPQASYYNGAQSVVYNEPVMYGQPVANAFQPVAYSEPVLVSQPMTYATTVSQPVVYEHPQPMVYGNPQAMMPPQSGFMPYDVQPYTEMYQQAASDASTNHYPPALPKSRPYRRPL